MRHNCNAYKSRIFWGCSFNIEFLLISSFAFISPHRLLLSIIMTVQSMLIKVSFKIWGIAAKFTKVAFFLGMCYHMLFKLTICFKLVIALWTTEWSFIRMRIYVMSQVLLTNVFFLAKTALERNFLCMSTHMNDNICTTFETKITCPNLFLGMIRCGTMITTLMYF